MGKIVRVIRERNLWPILLGLGIGIMAAVFMLSGESDKVNWCLKQGGVANFTASNWYQGCSLRTKGE